MRNIKDIRLNCGHLMCCNCAERYKILPLSQKKCPICREEIRDEDMKLIYYNKYLLYKAKYFALKNKN